MYNIEDNMKIKDKYNYTTFHTKNSNVLKEPMFFGNPVSISRFDQQKYIIFEKLIEKQLSFFWRPEEIDLTKDRIDFKKFSKIEKHIFISNLQYQILLDSIQGRSPNIALLPIISIPELETWVETWSFYETIHSRSYTHIIRSIIDNPSEIFDQIVVNKNIIKRVGNITKYYDDLIKKTQIFQNFGAINYQKKNKNIIIDKKSLKKALFLALNAINVLEGIRFYISFACAFAFSEQKKIEGCGKIIKLIARDESLHLTSTQHIINIILSGKDGDKELTDIAKNSQDDVKNIFYEAIEQEKSWAKYLFSEGSILGLNEQILCQYIDYLAYERMSAINLKYKKKNIPRSNPIPWINAYFNSDSIQEAPQETEISSYLVGQINSSIKNNAFKDFKL